MYGPGGVSVTKWGYVYIGDQGNSVVRMVDTCRFPYVASITGAVTLCSGATIHLADSTPGGAWSSGATTIATIGSTGIVTGISGGAVSISYSLTNSCGATTSSVLAVTVNTVPNAGAISGADTVCAGDTISLTDPSTGGNWYSTNTSISTITGSGMAIGVSGGTATIQYIETNMCGSDTATYAVTVLPASECPSGVKGIGNAPTPTLSVFPNPNPGAFTFHLLSPIHEGAQISITNLLGEKVREMTITTNQEYEMQLTTPGIYFLNAVNLSGTLTLSKKIEVY